MFFSCFAIKYTISELPNLCLFVDMIILCLFHPAWNSLGVFIWILFLRSLRICGSFTHLCAIYESWNIAWFLFLPSFPVPCFFHEMLSHSLFFNVAGAVVNIAMLEKFSVIWQYTGVNRKVSFLNLHWNTKCLGLYNKCN